MGERLNSSKEALRKAIDVLERHSWGDLKEEEVRGLVARILSARDALVQNEKKIWLKTKKGREMLGEFDTASKKLLQILEAGSDLEELSSSVEQVEGHAKQLNEEIRRRSMVVT
jgi:hypothetical protein